jgi:hypothetical protein
MKKTNFLLYKDNLKAVIDLTDAEAGQLFKAIYSWVNGRKVYEIEDVKTQTIFDFVFKKHLENDLVKYKEQCDVNSNNGKKGGRPKKAKKPNGLLNNQSKAKKGDKGIDTDIDTDKDIKKIYLDFVKLTEKEYTKLNTDYGKEVIDSFMIRLNDYVGSTGKKYKSHYHTILSWLRKDNVIKDDAKPKTNAQLYYEQVEREKGNVGN